MYKRIFPLLLTLALLLCASPALAAEGGVNILTKDGPVWVGTQREADTLRLIWSSDRGKSWSLADGYVYDTGLTDIQDVQYTGRDYFLTGYQCKFAYTSDDGKLWTQMKIINQPWFEENAGYITNGLCSGSYQLLWTGTEYLMRQSIQGDPRQTHNMRSPNPRNRLVTVLDENYTILSSVAFDGEVESIRYENGMGYAAVDGVEHSFTRADWENNFEGPGIVYRRFYSDGTVILQQEVNSRGMGRGRCSYDGVSWTQVPDGEEVSFSEGTTGMRAHPYFASTGRGFVRIGAYQRDSLATVDGLHWFSVGDRDWLLESADCWTSVSLEGRRDLQFVWTGTEYLVCQDVAHFGPDLYAESAANTKVFFLDENYDQVRQYDFGSKVLRVGCHGGICYAQVQAMDPDSGLSAPAVFASEDGERWEETDLKSIPVEAGSLKKQPLEGGVYAGGYVLRLEGGSLLVSDDGVYFTPLDTIPPYQDMIPVPYGRMEAYPGRDGMQLRLMAVGGDGSSVLNEKEVSYINADIDAAIAAAFPGDRCYASLDGAYISFDDPPYAKNQRVMVPLRNISEALGFTVEWVKEDGRDLAVCTRDGVTVRVEIGSSRAEVNGEACALEAPSEVLRGRTYVPIRFFSEQFGLDVDWDQATRTVLLKSKTDPFT